MRLAKTSDGRPALLLPATRSRRPPIELRSLRALFNVPCRISGDAGQSEEIVSLIECRSSEEGLALLFLQAVVPAILYFPKTPADYGVDKVVSDFVELFRALSTPALQRAEGLWGELFLLAGATDPVEAARAWHRDPTERFDYVSEDLRLEVKTTLRPIHQHRFSLEQLRQKDSRILIASIVTQRVGNGVSVSDLMRKVQERLVGHPDDQMRVLQVASATLGEEWEVADRLAFDGYLGAQTLRFVDARDIPAVQEPVSPRVSGISFDVDIDGLPSVAVANLRGASGLWAALAPTRA